MIWIYLLKNDIQNFNDNIIEWVRKKFQKNNVNYRIKFCRTFLFDSDYEDVLKNDYIFWNPYLAAKNLDIVLEFKNSIVILERETLLTEKLSETNPINENLAYNYGFYLMYLNETEKYSNEFRLAIKQSDYLMLQETIINKIFSDKNNFRTIKIERKDMVNNIDNINKNQINCDTQ